jgi:hypothetical protein
MSWSFSIDVNLTSKMLNTIGQEAREAAVRSLNESAQDVKKRAIEVISSGYNIKPEAVESRLKVKDARENNLQSEIRASGSKIELIEFSSMAAASGVTVLVKTSHGRKLVHPQAAASKGFIATPASGKTGIFVRQTDKRYPIRRLFGPSIPQLFGSKDIVRDLSSYAEEQIEHHIDEEFR